MQKPGDERGDQAVRSSPAPGEGECSGGNDTGPLEGGVLGPPAHRNAIIYYICHQMFLSFAMYFTLSYI